MLCDEGLELRDKVAVPAAGKVGVDARLNGCEPRLLEPTDLRLREGQVRQVLERRAAPQLEGFREARRGRVGVTRGERVSALRGDQIEPAHVDLLGRQLEQVARLSRHQCPGAVRLQELSKCGDEAVERDRRSGRWALAPERV